jgi:hypothetical protein
MVAIFRADLDLRQFLQVKPIWMLDQTETKRRQIDNMLPHGFIVARAIVTPVGL